MTHEEHRLVCKKCQRHTLAVDRSDPDVITLLDRLEAVETELDKWKAKAEGSIEERKG
jgi:hypothetical protein